MNGGTHNDEVVAVACQRKTVALCVPSGVRNQQALCGGSRLSQECQ